MNKILCIVLCASLLFGSTGCALFKNPNKAWDKAVAKNTQAQAKADNNEHKIIEQGKGYVYATKLALDADPSTNQFHQVETLLNDKAVEVLGPPTMDEADALRIMVTNLLSTNQQLIAKGQKQLAAKDSEVIELQTKNESLQAQIDKAQAKIESVGKENAAYASRWVSLLKLFWYCVYGFIAVLVIRVLSVVLPPPYNSIVSIISVPIGLVIKGIQGIVPEAKKAAGVVAEGAFSNTKLALEHVIEAIEEAKKANPDAIAALKPFLKDATSKEVTRPVINEVKQELGYN